jgi:hypothetical protein
VRTTEAATGAGDDRDLAVESQISHESERRGVVRRAPNRQRRASSHDARASTRYTTATVADTQA